MNKKLNLVLAVALTIVALATGQTAWAESTWTVEVTDHNDNTNVTTFTITRSEKTYAQTVLYRTVGLSAYAGQHFTATSGSISFGKNEDSKTVEVTEKTPAANAAYKYQSGSTSRSYKLEVTDRAGYLLKGCTRNINYNGTSINSSNAFAEKSVTVSGGTNGIITVTDAGFTQAYYAIPIADYYTAAAPKDYLVAAGAELRMKVEFEEAEKDDGYQHIQLLVNQTSQCDNSANKGNPGAPNKSRYLASFAHKPGSTLTSYAKVCFPLTSASDNCSEIDPAWNFSPYNNSVGKLYTQKFKSGYRDSDGRLIIALKTELSALSSVGIRFDASGDNNDTWYAKNTVAKIQAVDLTYPSRIAMTANPGRHAKYNSFYVSVALSEIVTSTNATLSTSWGPMTLEAGSGTNVLTFKGSIKADASGALNVTSWSGNITDLSGRDLNICGINFFNQDNLATLDADFAYTLDDFQQDGDNYLIKTHEDLIGLAGYVNGGGATTGKTFLQVADITFAHTTDWNSSSSTENNYTAIGYYMASDDQKNFEGTYDGGGHTISGIRIYRNNNTDSDNYQGLFGHVKSNGAIRNVNLSDTRITGRSTVGGIVGYNKMGTVEDCTVAANVCIHQIYGGSIHGGVVGNNLGSVKRCISSAHLTVKNGISTSGYGGIVGRNENAITDCIATDVVIPDVNARGAIVGVLYYNGTLTRNYYHGCKVASDNVTPSGVGQGTADSKTTSDVDGAQPLWAVTLPNHASVVRTPATDPLPGTDNAIYDNGADINGVPYAKGSSVVNLSYDPATITEGYDVLLSVKQTSDNTAVAFTDNGNHTYAIASMPAADITVSVTEIPIIAYIDADGNPQSHACTPIVEGTTSYQTLGRTEGWYVVNSDVTISGTQGVKFLDQQVNIILCDGTTLTSNATTTGYNGIEVKNGSLAIYGQSLGTGSIVATASNYSAISSKTSINLNGGIISGITNSGYAAITNDSGGGGSITIRRGNVTATGSTFGIRDLGESSGIVILGGTVNATATHATNGIGLYSAYGDISILGGNVTATGSCAGIEAGGSKATTITLGCTTPADRITASSYDCATLTITDGQILSDGTDTYSGTLSSEQKTAIAGKTLSAAIPYIDADGTTKYKASKDLTFITTSTLTYGDAANAEGWYCVNSDVNFTHNVYFNDQMVNIILCDGATMSCEKYSNYNLISVNNGSLAIYGQTHGTGTLSLNCTAVGSAIFANSNIDINGGTINASSLRGIGIKANNAITIRRGNITTKGSGYGFSASTVTLGCATTADRIYATGYKGTVTIADGQILSDGTDTYSGTLNDMQISAMAGQTLRPYGLALAMNSAGIMTYASPYALDLSNVNAYVVSDYNSGNSTLTLTKVTEAPANTGLLLKAKDDGQKNTTIALPLQESAEAVGTNLLVGVLSGATIVPKTYGSYTNFILANGKYGIDWYTLSEAGTIGANKAYLQLPTAEVSSGRAFTWVYDDGTATKIERPTPDPSLYGGEWYDLNGRKLKGKPTTKGLYIHNGRKEVVR